MRVARLATVVWLVAAPCAAEEPFHVYQDGGRVVVTNMPTPDSRPLPRQSGQKRSGSMLPETPYDRYIEHVAAEHGLPVALIKSVALVESGFDAQAVSPKGAQGLMQLMPETAREYGVKDAFDPLENLRAGARHLRHLLDQFDGDVTLALAAYNAGAGAVRRYGGVPNYKETRNYVRKVHDSMGRRQRRPRHPVVTKGDPVRVERSRDGSISLVN